MLILIMTQIASYIKPDNMTYADSIRYPYYVNDNINYPGYKERIDAIKRNHPSWNFVIMETGLDWNEVIDAEYTGHFETPKNLIQGKSGGWVCSICGSKPYDTGDWMCASESAIRYYMDPRNWIVDSPYLFQFLQTDYMETSDNDVYISLNGTFLYSWENASIINKVCREKNASPYFIIARLLQEQGNGGGMTYKMQDTDGTIYYNLFNIGATGNTKEEVYNNALAKAKQMGWTSIESCLSGGISFLLSSYIAYKQNTLYLNKFDVETYMGTYTKQYMQNVEAPKSEGLSMYNKMKNANLLDKNLTFIIPVYENMPELSSPSPDTSGEAYPKNIRVKEGHYGIMIRAGRSTSSTILGRINDSTVNVLSVERFTDGWHKIVLENGTLGYVKFNTNYLEEINDITNCYEKMTIKNDGVILRAGPGINHTEITVLRKGEEITRIDNSGRYNFEGSIWDRIILSDGRQGFISRENLRNINEGTPPKEEQNTTIGEIENNTTNSETNENQIINEILEENNIVENKVNNEEIEQNKTEERPAENILQGGNVIGNETSENTNKNETGGSTSNQPEPGGEDIEDDTQNEGERKYLIIAPDKKAEDLGGIVTKDGKETEEAGTGYKIIIEDKEYIIVKRGDANGDGYVKANDYLIIKDYIIGNKGVKLEKEYLQAADVTNDKAVKANDYLKIKDHIMYGVEI